jgi:pyridoxal phosphate-dependent aminotransferase EpsN
MEIYLSPPDLSGDELSGVQRAVASNWIAPLGPEVDAFETEVAARVGMPYALATSSVTAALHLAILVAGVRPGDEVWTATLTFAATANPIKYAGGVPVFFDAALDSWCIDPVKLVAALEHAAAEKRLPRAIIVVDLYGQCADVDAIAESCRRHGVILIEDAAEALGATYRGRPAGSLGDLTILSFNGNKIITTSGGGMLLARERDVVERARYLATQAREPVRHYEHACVGYNYRLSNLLAAVGRAQLADLDRRVSARRRINQLYRRRLAALPGWSFMPEAATGTCTFWLTCATIDPADFGASRDEVIDALARNSIEARPVWKPLHRQPAFADSRIVGGAVAERLFETGICLPSGSRLSDEQVDRICSVVVECKR